MLVTNSFSAIARAILALCLFSLFATASDAQFYHEWLGGTGSWANPSNWSTATVPGTGTVDIGYVGGPTGSVTLDGFDPLIENLLIGSNGRLTILSNLRFANIFENQGAVTVAGVLAPFSPFGLDDAFQLEGGGTIRLDGGSIQSGEQLNNVDNLIEGTGTIGVFDNGVFVNDSTIHANINQQRLELFGPIVNNSLLEARNGGILHLSGEIRNSANGVIRSEIDSTIEIQNAHISGGTLDMTTGSHSFRGFSSLENLTLHGDLRFQNELSLQGVIRNEGTLYSEGPIAGSISSDQLELRGGGMVQVDTMRAFDLNGSSEFWNVDNHINVRTVIVDSLQNDGHMVSDGGVLRVASGVNRGVLRNFNVPEGVVDNDNGIIEIDRPEGAELRVSGGVVRVISSDDSQIPIRGRLDGVHFEGDLRLAKRNSNQFRICCGSNHRNWPPPGCQ